MSLKNDPVILKGILFESRIVFISARGRVGCSPDKTRKTLVEASMLGEDANKYIHNPLSESISSREKKLETVKGNTKPEPDSSPQKTP